MYYILKNSALNDGISSGMGRAYAPPPKMLFFFLLKLALKNFNA
jgi:hypothetical protein